MNRRRTLRFAHLTDIHLLPDRNAPEGFAECLRNVNRLEDPVEFILTGGDLVMDAFGKAPEEVAEQWALFHQVLAAENRLPVIHTLGNHDHWVWPGSDTDPRGGKRWALSELGLERPYYSLERGGWKIIILDSTMVLEHGYTAKLDDEQFEWLEKTLSETPSSTPVLVVSHVPIASFCVFLDGDNEGTGDWRVPGAWMHIDVRRIKDLFLRHPNVKAALSGHVHLVERVDYLGVSYFCNGAVCGGWWNGPYQECPAGYAVVNLHDNGEIECEYIDYGWHPVPPVERV